MKQLRQPSESKRRAAIVTSSRKVQVAEPIIVRLAEHAGKEFADLVSRVMLASPALVKNFVSGGIGIPPFRT